MRIVWAATGLVGLCAAAQAQEIVSPYPGTEGVATGVAEPLFLYDDLDRWKHGWVRVVPFSGGYHSFRPYNYQHVLSQSRIAAEWGMPPAMPYSQQFWHRYEEAASLSGQANPPASADPRREYVSETASRYADSADGSTGTSSPPSGLAPARYGHPPQLYRGGGSVGPEPAFRDGSASRQPLVIDPVLP